MMNLQQQLKAVHKDLTDLGADARLSSHGRKKVAKAATRVMAISQQLSTISETNPPTPAEIQLKRSLVRKAFRCLRSTGKMIMDYLFKNAGNNDEP